MNTISKDKVFSVKPIRDENDDYVELWQSINNPNCYFGRLTLYGGIWYTVCDPLGYCEINNSCPETWTFRVHGYNGNYLFDSHNGGKQPIATRDAIKEAMKSVDMSEINPHSYELGDYKLSFLTKEVEERLHTMGKYCIRDNFRDTWYDYESGEVEQFVPHLGRTLMLWRVRCKHKFADFEWYEYMYSSGDIVNDKYSDIHKWVGWQKITENKKEI